MSTPSADAVLCGPGGPFEMTEEVVLGERMHVFKQRARSLRAFVEGSAAFGDSEYLVFGDRRITFAEHRAIVASVAKALSERFGVRKGDRVAVLAENRPEWIMTFWAALSLGAVVVGMNGWWTGDEILYALGDAGPKLLVGDRKRLDRLGGSRIAVPVVEMESSFDALASHDRAAPLPDIAIDEDDRAVILYTSGTTGRPKGVVHTHRNVIALIGAQFLHWMRLRAAAPAQAEAESGRPCHLTSSPLFHVSGLYSAAVAHMVGGLKSVWTVGRFDPIQVLSLIERERVTGWAPQGTLAWRVIRHPDVHKFDLSSMRTLGGGGAPVPATLQAALRQVFPNARQGLGIGYGLTEGTALATLNTGAELIEHPDSVGRPVPTVQIEIRDESGKRVSDGTVGEITLRGPLVMLEYWRNPDATAASIGPGRWLRTGDIGSMKDGRLYIATRMRDLILRGAENIYPVEIESRLAAHPAVLEAAVIGVAARDAALGQEVKAIVVPDKGAAVDFDELGRWVGEALAYYKIPSQWELRSEPLPRNASGKVMKYLLCDGGVNPYAEE